MKKHFDRHRPFLIAAAFIVMAASAYNGLSAESGGTVTAWLHKYDWEKAVASVKEHADLIREVSPAWYEIGDDGSVRYAEGAPANNKELLQIVRDEGIQLMPLISNVSPTGARRDPVRSLFKDSFLRHRHIDTLVMITTINGYDGIDLDYEGFQGSELESLATLVEELAEALHASDKLLAVSIEAQNDETAIGSWKRIGAAADRVRFMAYGQKPKHPGPISEPEWVREHLERALRAIPAEKLILGMAIYGLKWDSSGKVSSGTWDELSGPTSADERVWVETGSTIAVKIQVAKELGVDRFAFWRLGGEDPDIWEVVSEHGSQ